MYNNSGFELYNKQETADSSKIFAAKVKDLMKWREAERWRRDQRAAPKKQVTTRKIWKHFHFSYFFLWIEMRGVSEKGEEKM